MKGKMLYIDSNGWVKLIHTRVIFCPEQWRGETVYRMRDSATHRPAEIWEMHGICQKLEEIKDMLTGNSEKNLAIEIKSNLTAYIMWLESNGVREIELAKEEAGRYRQLAESRKIVIDQLQSTLRLYKIVVWLAIAEAIAVTTLEVWTKLIIPPSFHI